MHVKVNGCKITGSIHNIKSEYASNKEGKPRHYDIINFII